MADEQPKSLCWPPPRRQAVVLGVVALACLLIGFLPMWLAARSARAELRDAQRELKLTRLQASLGSAVVDARSGNYEPARQSTSWFYSRLVEQLDARESPLSPAQREQAKQLLSRRDQLITLLARADPAAGERLSELFVEYKQMAQGVASANVGGAGEKSLEER